jgi:hypothetical protein
MANLGRYCKAYYWKDLRNFPGLANVTPASGKEQLSDESILYLHDDLSLTSGIVCDEDVVYQNTEPDWQTYCRTALKFEVPEWCSNDSIHESSGN